MCLILNEEAEGKITAILMFYYEKIQVVLRLGMKGGCVVCVFTSCEGQGRSESGTYS